MPGEEVVVHARERAAAGKPSQQGRGDAEPKQLTFTLHAVSSLHGRDGNRAHVCKQLTAGLRDPGLNTPSEG